MSREQNWANNYTFKAAHIHRPDSLDELRGLVARLSKVRAIGARHSFNGIADSPDDLIDLSAFDPHFVTDAPQQTVTVSAATTYTELVAYLQTSGWALHNMASLPHISIAGAISTGTHGSGDTNGTLSTAVAGLEFVASTGDLVQIRRGNADFDGIVVGLGAFGIITRITLDIQPRFEIRQDAFADLPWAALLDSFDEIMSAAYSVSVLTRWSGKTVDRVWLKTRLTNERTADIPEARWGAVPALHPYIGDKHAEGCQLTEFGVPGPWSQRLPHVQSAAGAGANDQIQSEYMVPRHVARVAFGKLRAIGAAIDSHLIATEIRTVMGDSLWLSPCYGHDTVAIHFTWKSEPEPVHAITSKIEDTLLPLGGRPHWGKLIHADARQLARLYPRLHHFRDLVRTYDPAGKFRNEFLDKHVFGEAE